jgi:hypothetical protein
LPTPPPHNSSSSSGREENSSIPQQQQQQQEDPELLDLMVALVQQQPEASAAAAVTGPLHITSSEFAAAAAPVEQLTSSHMLDDEHDMEGDESLRVVCWERACTVGLMHGSDVHLCLCGVCFAAYDVSKGCPMCRQPVEDAVDLA